MIFLLFGQINSDQINFHYVMMHFFYFPFHRISKIRSRFKYNRVAIDEKKLAS